MKKHLEDILSMFIEADGVMTDWSAVWEENAPMVTTMGLIRNNINAIQAERAIQEGGTQGFTADKAQKREALSNAIIVIAGALHAYASVGGNAMLKKDSNILPSKLERAKDTEVHYLGTKILELATTNLLALAPYGVLQATLDDLESKIDAYRLVLESPMQQKDRIRAATVRIETLISETENLWADRIDRPIIMYKSSHPEFITQYFEARLIKDSPTTKVAARGHVQDSATQLPLYNVQVNLLETDEKHYTSVKGNFRYINAPEGPLNFEFTLVGYAPHVEPVLHLPGETVEMTINLNRL